ncbi:hypothetical protein GCM10011297_00290 [Bacterioplanes sanyensis]|nr:hypothetical protein GCM10011297_00290 [Bacterioplanes sanyensis]
MVAAIPQVSTLYEIGAMNTNDDAKNTGTERLVISWNNKVPKPAVNRATDGFKPVINGISTKAPKATNNICRPASAVRQLAAEEEDVILSPAYLVPKILSPASPNPGMM